MTSETYYLGARSSGLPSVRRGGRRADTPSSFVPNRRPPDHSLYHDPAFAPSDLASSILAGTTYHPPSTSSQAAAPASSSDRAKGKEVAKEELKEESKGKGDAGLAIARLSFSIEEVTRLLKAEVCRGCLSPILRRTCASR
jgi:hypothetical protein